MQHYGIKFIAAGRWVSPGTPVSSTNNTDRHDMIKMLLQVVLNTIILTTSPSENIKGEEGMR